MTAAEACDDLKGMSDMLDQHRCCSDSEVIVTFL
jgi:hypothetical protein